ncbi:MAG: dCTP deaminase [Methanomicrobiales archaeon]|jgi:dCTP deaminase|nr:dCTP deaminase [Methanomicrobiales archaeon]
MILSSREIEGRLVVDAPDSDEVDKECLLPPGCLAIRPFSPTCLQPASYDLRVRDAVILSRGICTLVPTLEWVEFPADLAATLRCRSSYGRRGLIVTGGFVDPGFRGQLTLCLINLGPEDLVLHKEDRVVQMIIYEVMEGGRAYEGKYQDSLGAIGAL